MSVLSTVRLFQSTHPRGVRHQQTLRLFRFRGLFQSTHPRGVRRTKFATHVDPQHVSIHAPAWGATRRFWSRPAILRCFNPRTRVGCDQRSRNIPTRIGWFQSTHPRGVRLRWQSFRKKGKKFQSTHPRGVRHDSGHVSTLHRGCFNPRTRVGCDAVMMKEVPHGAECFNPRTRVGCDGPRPRQGRAPGPRFNPRTRVGCDGSLMVRLSLPLVFQSTHPRGVRHPERRTAGGQDHRFNPRTRVGCDAPCGQRDAGRKVSIHAPAWGATTAAFLFFDLT